MNILVTGSSGFIGSRLVPFLGSRGHNVTAPSRNELPTLGAALQGIDVVIHLAAVAHTNSANLQDYEQINYRVPIQLARDARDAGVKRFIFMSSTHAQSHPHTPYGQTKARAEADLTALDGIEMVIVRAPLVYGPGVKGNMKSLLSLSRLPVPLPFRSAHNKRSLIYLENLVDALAFLLCAPAGTTYTATDSEPVSLADILIQFRAGLGRRPGLFSAPWLAPFLHATGRSGLAEKLLDASLHDGSQLFAAGWAPPFATKDALRMTASYGNGTLR